MPLACVLRLGGQTDLVDMSLVTNVINGQPRYVFCLPELFFSPVIETLRRSYQLPSCVCVLHAFSARDFLVRRKALMYHQRLHRMSSAGRVGSLLEVLMTTNNSHFTIAGKICLSHPRATLHADLTSAGRPGFNVYSTVSQVPTSDNAFQAPILVTPRSVAALHYRFPTRILRYLVCCT